jgi:superfamily II DNA or RNA helicase
MWQVCGAVRPSSSQTSETTEPTGASSSQTSVTTEPNLVKRRTPEEWEVNRAEALRRKAQKDVRIHVLRPLQMKAVAALERTDWQNAIIVMPTGSGKTTLVWSFKKEAECSIVIAPYKLLVDQLVAVLGEFGKTFRWPLTEQQGSAESLLSTAKFVVTSFETAPGCAGLITQLQQRRRLGPIWVDEVWRYVK